MDKIRKLWNTQWGYSTQINIRLHARYGSLLLSLTLLLAVVVWAAVR